MTGMHKRELERQGATDHGNRLLWFLVVVTIASGGVGLVAFFREGERSWPRPLAFGWFAIFATGLVIELVRRRRAAQQGAATDAPQRARS